MRVTHKGWFGLCPVYLGHLDSPAPLVLERHPMLMPLMVVSEFFFDLCFAVRGFTDPTYEPAWPIRITGTVEPFDVEPR